MFKTSPKKLKLLVQKNNIKNVENERINRQFFIFAVV